MNYPNFRTPSYLPVRTVVKFYDNHLPEGSRRDNNTLISKTLKKVAVIDSEWAEQNATRLPSDQDFYLVDVVHETCPGLCKGCFIVRPIRKVDGADVGRLLPGMFIEHEHQNLLIAEPKIGGVYWILTLKHRQALKHYGVVVKQ